MGTRQLNLPTSEPAVAAMPEGARVDATRLRLPPEGGKVATSNAELNADNIPATGRFRPCDEPLGASWSDHHLTGQTRQRRIGSNRREIFLPR
jgi:hypothetical protein